MDYIGSKAKLNEWIFNIIKNSFPQHKQYIFLDACSGSGVVSQYAAEKGYNVVSNDIMEFSSHIINGSIGITENQKNTAKLYIDKFNLLSGIKGYFYKNFCEESNDHRLYFSVDNSKRIDHIREEIEKIKDIKIKDYLLYCSLEAISRVSNTTGVQAAYLKKLKDRALDKINIKIEKTFIGNADVYCSDILKLLSNKNFRSNNKEDILYIDPPYNQRQYGPNYHLYETFIKNDNPTPMGMTGLRNWKEECHSKFCSNKLCLNFLKDIINNTSAKLILVSYNSDGLIKEKDFINSFPNIKIHKKEQRRYKSDTSVLRDYNQKELFEYLFEIKK